VEKLSKLSEYRLTLIGFMITLILPIPLLQALGIDPKTYLIYAGPALTIILGVFRTEKNAIQLKAHRSENMEFQKKLVMDNEALKKALEELLDPNASVADAAKVALENMPPPPNLTEIKD
jgi:hypothetical protein